ncbi:MAG: hypothetical protein GXP25_21850 [Planctomycetes bacterium]|nr:hypothetical protein [Planctomycetota bacterium]
MVVNDDNLPDEAQPFWPRAWKPLAVAVAVHLAILIGYAAFFHFNPSCFLNVGAKFQWADEKHFAPGTVKFTKIAGYDACDYYLVALDPLLLKKDVAPTYKIPTKFMRYQRFLYPLLINLLTCDTPAYFPYAMVLINLASMIGMTIVLMKLLAQRGSSPWLALIFVLGGGMLLAFWLALQMHLCFFLIISAIYYYENKKVEVSALLFALALVTWESAVLFAGPIGLWELLHRRWKNVVCFALVLVPFLCSQAYFAHKLGAKMFSGSPAALSWPFVQIVQGISISIRNTAGHGTLAFLRSLLAFPVIALLTAMLVVACWKLWRRKGGLYNLMLLLQLLFVIIQATEIWLTFSNAMRINAGLFLPLLLSYRDQKERVSPWLFAGVLALSALALLKIAAETHQPWGLIGGG